MYIKDYISKDYPVFSKDYSVEEASEIAQEYGYSHIFIVEKDVLIGSLSLSFIEDSSAEKLGDLLIHYEKFAIFEDGSLLDTIKLFYTFDTNIVPVISKGEMYLGYILTEDVFNEFSKYPLFSENAAILTIQTSGRYSSFTEISQIVESNNAKLYGCFISKINDDNVEITLKISGESLTSIEETFERYGYTIINKHYDNEKDEFLRDRYGFFQKFIET